MSTETQPATPYERLADLAGVQRGPCRECGHGATFSQRDLAKTLGVNPSTMSRFKSGDDLSMSTVRRIAAALGKTPAEVVAALWPDEETTDA